MYIYESHMGGLYVSDCELPLECLYCEECGDSDYFIGFAGNAMEARQLLYQENIYLRSYIDKFVRENFS